MLKGRAEGDMQGLAVVRQGRTWTAAAGAKPDCVMTATCRRGGGTPARAPSAERASSEEAHSGLLLLLVVVVRRERRIAVSVSCMQSCGGRLEAGPSCLPQACLLCLARHATDRGRGGKGMGGAREKGAEAGGRYL